MKTLVCAFIALVLPWTAALARSEGKNPKQAMQELIRQQAKPKPEKKESDDADKAAEPADTTKETRDNKKK